MARPPRSRPHRARHGGFTLLEVIIVIVIIGLLATVVVQNLAGEVDKARVTKAQADVRALESALNMYKLDNFRFPTTEQGLRALSERPTAPPEARNWRAGGYITTLPQDPWGNPYQYLSPGQHGSIDVFSLGADGKVGGQGDDADVGNWDPQRP
jgi:general secretion pathway protein G